MYYSWTGEEWKKVLYTGKSEFEFFGSARQRHYVLKMQGKQIKFQCVFSTVKQEKGNIKKVEEIRNKEGYHQIW